ncbi:lytic transglycosylase domain-containing protein [Candidatus Competibacter phosphatis]|jgi:soluble lytic murein transglycosylase-like protein|uniref:Lytic transglycosylase domain-containing protein n=1 Tax=Candidatus Competibacter phosphatis TaxID=221280 RepID=A0ABX1TNM7_9GAMM|nr:lytic transglycosylase domain-containing protein [Candidatus Competibacter phosphatis]NMQ20164.1 lytic transglycosylase domain-containing protein [Candidatus Competibacter phosphatis]
MEFTECVKERLTLTLKSGLLCAAFLVPVAALAQSPETIRGEEPNPIIAAINSDFGADFGADADADADAVELKPADQRKVTSLSNHIQSKYRVPEARAQRIVREAIRNGKRHDVDPELILAVIAVESTFKERAVSRVGARGLMQVMPGSHKGKIRKIGGTRELFDPAKNIHTGSQILVEYLEDHSGDLRRALLNYNGSLGTRSSFPDKVIRIYRGLQRVTVEG